MYLHAAADQELRPVADAGASERGHRVAAGVLGVPDALMLDGDSGQFRNPQFQRVLLGGVVQGAEGGVWGVVEGGVWGGGHSAGHNTLHESRMS